MEGVAKADPSNLETLAGARFGPLNEAERRLLRAAQLNDFAYCGQGEDLSHREYDPAHAEQWDVDRTIRAELVEWVCLDPAAREQVAPSGVQLFGARFDDRLKLSFARLPFPVCAVHCWLPQGIVLDHAEVPALVLSGSRVGKPESRHPRGTEWAAVEASGVRIWGPAKLSGMDVEGEVRLFAADIGSTLECDGSVFKNSHEVALNCENAKLGSVYLREGFEAEGCVLLRGAEIRGSLNCAGGSFKNVGKEAIEGQGAKIEGAVFCCYGFKAEGVGDSFAHRAYHALPKTIRRKGNRPAGAIVGFANILLRLYEQEQPRAVLVGWDTLDAATYRTDLLPSYQSGRHFDDDLVEQLERLPEFVAACGFANAKASGYEADDFLAAAVAKEEKRGGNVAVASGDRDAFQLASENTTILYPVKGGEVVRIGPHEVRERYGVDPKQVPDFIALRGDPSDRLPGARGIGPTSAARLLRRHQTLEALLATGQFPAQANHLRLYRRIATMDPSAPLPSLRAQKPKWLNAAQLACGWELNQLRDRLTSLARTPLQAKPDGTG